MRHLLCSLLLLLGGIMTASAEQRLRDGDIFRLQIGGPPRVYTTDFESEYTVDGGAVILPMIGRVPVVNLTQSQLAAEIEKRLKDGKIFTNPNVIIALQRAQATVVVGGAVRSPGRQGWVAEMTLTQVLAAAGGPSDFAKDTVRIVRANKSTTFSRKAIRKDPTLDPKILIGDFIDQEGDF